MRGLVGLLLAIFLLTSLGCSGEKQRSIVDTWSFDRSSEGVDAATRYNADGTWEDWFRGSKINNTSRGTYKLEGSTLSVTTLESTMTSGKVNKEAKTSTMTLRWLSKDKIELSMPEGSGTYTRRPE